MAKTPLYPHVPGKGKVEARIAGLPTLPPEVTGPASLKKWAMKPTRGDVEIHTWSERDRLHIEIRNKRTDKTVAEWWDDDARQMFEDGFFKPGFERHEGIEGNAFQNSVLEYAENMGILKK